MGGSVCDSHGGRLVRGMGDDFDCVWRQVIVCNGH